VCRRTLRSATWASRAWSTHSGLGRGQEPFNPAEEVRQVPIQNPPNLVEIDIVVLVDHPISHPGHQPPGDIGMALAQLRGEPLDRLSQD